MALSFRRFLGIFCLLILLGACAAPPETAALPEIDVLIHTPADIVTLRTTERIPSAILAQAGLELAPEEQLFFYGSPIDLNVELPLASHYDFEIRPAIQIELLVDGQSQTFSSAAPTLARALWDAGFTLYSADRLLPAPETLLESPITATLARARPLQITLAGKLILTRSAAGTVGEALAEAGLALQGLDYSLPAENAPIPEDGQIRVVRVSEQVVIEQQPLNFETVFQPSDQIEIDNVATVQAGQFGLTAERIRVRYEDGVEVSRQVEDQWVAREPVPRIQGYGTQIVVRTENTADGPIEYWRAVEVYATSYSPSRSGVDPSDPGFGITYSGEPLHKGIIAVLRSWYPSMGGRNFYVPGYGVGTVLDIGGGIAGRHWIDLGYSDDDFVNWHSWTTLYFLTPVPPADQILWILP